MAEPHFAHDDDLPRTLRRERDAREREARDREAALATAAAHAQDPRHGGLPGHHDYAPPSYAATEAAPSYMSPEFSGTVNRFEVPFLHLVKFFIKAVFAAIPALLLLSVLLFAGGKVLQAFYPGLRLFEIVVRSTGPAATVEPVAPVAPPAKQTPAAKK